MKPTETTWHACVATMLRLRTTDPGVLAYHEADLYQHDRAALARPNTRLAIWVVYRSGTHLGWIPDDPPPEADSRDLRVWREQIAELAGRASLWIDAGYFPGAYSYILDTATGSVTPVDAVAWFARKLEHADERITERRDRNERTLRVRFAR